MIRRNPRLARPFTALLAGALLVGAGGLFLPVGVARGQGKDALKKEQERIARRKALKGAFNSSERIVADIVEGFALETVRDWDGTMEKLLAEDSKHLLNPLRYYLLDDDWEVQALAAETAGRADLVVLLPELEEAYDETTYAIVRRRVMEAVEAFAKDGVKSTEPVLVKGAKDEEPGVRLLAAAGLEWLGDEASRDVLRELFDDKDPDTRYRARTALARLGDEKTQAALLEEFASWVDSKQKQRRASLVLRDVGQRYSQFLNALSLGEWGSKEAIELLGLAFLRKDRFENKLFLAVGAAAALGRSRPTDADARKLKQRILELGLKERDAETRAMAALAAGYTEDVDWVKPLSRLVSDAQIDVRHNAVEALGRMKEAGAVVPILGSVLRREKDVAIRLAALRALSHFPGEEATKGLVRGLADDRYMVRGLAATLLGRRGKDEADAVKMLSRSANDADYGVRENAVVALARIGAEAGLPAIVADLSDPDRGVRIHTMRALTRFRDATPIREDEETVDLAVTILTKTDDPSEEAAARELLLHLRSPLSVPPLIEALDSDRPAARHAALAVLRTFARGNSFGYSPKLDGNERKEAIDRFEKWWKDGVIAPPEPAPKVRANVDLPSFHKYARDLRWRGIDLVLCYDSTGSMIPVIRAVKQRLDLLIREASRIVPNLRMSLFTYRDEGEEYIYYGTPLTYAMDNLKSFVQVAEANRGGDLPEAITETVDAAIRHLDWRKDAQKVIVVIGDAPYHPENKDWLFSVVEKFATLENRGIVHAIYTDPNRLGESISARKSREDNKVTQPFLERLKELAEVGRGKAITIEDTEKLIAEILVLSFGEQWRDELESRLEFR